MTQFLSPGPIRIFYVDNNSESTAEPVILLHGLGLDHSSLNRLFQHFGQHRRVVAPDLRGHGASDALGSKYSMDLFADDIAELYFNTGIKRAVVVGHSMGGNIALTLAKRHPQLVSAIVLIDSALFINETMKQQLADQFAQFLTPTAALDFFKRALVQMCSPSDQYSQQIIDRLHVSADVLISALPEHTILYDADVFTRSLDLPLAYIASAMPLFDLDSLRRRCPQLVQGRTLGSGHLSPQEVPEQIIAMITRFLRMSGFAENQPLHSADT